MDQEVRVNEHKITIFFKKWSSPGLFCVYFHPFQTNNTIFLVTTNQCDKMSIQYKAPGFEPFKHEFSPITTGPGLPP